jgi:hypothetical protein
MAFYPGVTQNLEKAEAALKPEQKQQADAWVDRWVASHTAQ